MACALVAALRIKMTSPARERARPARHRSAKIEIRFFNLNSRGEVMDKVSRSQDSRIVAAGVDAAKSTFSVCAVDGARRIAAERTLNRARLLALFANLAPCTVGLEACSGAHQLARELTAMGHTVRIIAAKFVAPHLWQARPQRCPGDRRCAASSAHALCADQEPRAAGAAVAAAGTPWVCL